jgi:hypothetical protein
MTAYEPFWYTWQRRMDAECDRRFAQRVELYPWSGGQSVTDDGHADPTRPVLKTFAVYFTPRMRSYGIGAGGSGGSGMTTPLETGREWISITEENLGDPALWRAYDRVCLPDLLPNQQWHNIEKIDPSATKRYIVSLIRLQQGTD